MTWRDKFGVAATTLFLIAMLLAALFAVTSLFAAEPLPRVPTLLPVMALPLMPPLVPMALVQDAGRHDKYADDPRAFCLPAHIRPPNDHAHPCTCKMICGPADADGNRAFQEDGQCEMYCSKNRCTCHPEEPCPEVSAANQRMR